jgi:hypothetical protein
MKRIAELLSRDLSRRIEEVIQVDQAEEEAVFTEIDEYIATDSIRDQYAHLLKAIAEAPSDPNEAIGIWVSGFFGSGKSSYAKNLGYALQNNKVKGQDFSALFKKRIEDQRVSDLIDLINTRFPTEVIFFDIAKEQDTRRMTQRISEFLYVVLLRHLDYAEDFDIAELEIELEAEGRLEEFVKTCKKLHKQEWRMVRKGAQRISRASAILHEIDPKTYTTADSWTSSQRNRETSVTLTKVVERCFELVGRRRPGKALVWVIDEVGQHVARSDDKIEDLRAVVQEFGLVGRNLVKSRQIIAPTWIVVTSQEKLEEVVSALDSKRVQIAKLQDRFRHRVDLAPSDIREVATRRVLAKRDKAEPVLKKLFAENQGQLNAALRLERTTRKTEITETDFVGFYPYPPHYIDLCISIVSGLRLQPGAPKQYGGSNRTIIKQAYEMLVSERTDLKSRPIGCLVTLDKVYELVEGNLTTEKRTDIHEIGQRFKGDTEDQGWALRVAKVVCLLEFVRDLPRTEANIAAFLVDEVGTPAPLALVQAAIKKLQAAQFVRNTDEGWKLQTLIEKKWETERGTHLDPKGRERNEITRQVLREVFGEPALKTYKYKDHRSFSVGVTQEGTPISDGGNLTVTLASAEDNDELPKKLKEVREESRLDARKNDIYWCFALSTEIDQLVAELHASRKMVEKYDQLRAQNRISAEESSCLDAEKKAVLNNQNRLRDKFTEAMEHGTGLFRGVSWDASSLGKTLNEIYRNLYGNVVPDLYPKLEMGSRPLKGDEAEQILKAADLKALPQVFYAGEKGLGLVTKEGPKYVPNPAADVAREVLDYLIAQNDYGNREERTGKSLEKRFGGIGYGWDRDMLRLILAVLFRAGSIEVSQGGEKFTNYSDPRSRQPFTNNNAFKSALYTPVKPIDLKTLTRAVESYENLTGETVDVDKNAIAEALKKFAAEEIKAVLPVEAQAKAHQLPLVGTLQEYRDSLTTIEAGSDDDCVNALAGGGTSLKQSHDRIRKIADCLDEKGLANLRQAQQAVGAMWPQLEARGQVALREEVEQVKGLLAADDFYESLAAIENTAEAIATAYHTLYAKAHGERADQFQAAVEKIKGRADWEAVPDTMRQPVLQPLTTRCCTDLDQPEGSVVCKACGATLSQMESDLAALGGLFAQVVAQVQRLTTSEGTKVQRVRVSEFFGGAMETEEQVRQAVARLQDHLLKLLDEKVKIVVE